jgi:hypothetical protein
VSSNPQKKKKKKLVSATKHATNSVFLFFANVDKKNPKKQCQQKTPGRATLF